MFLLLFLQFLLAIGLSLSTSPTQATPTECPIEIPTGHDITCGFLTVPEDHDHPTESTVQLPYVVLHSTADNPAPDPVVFTSGGPGYSALPAVWWFATSRLLENRDVIIVEQRGNRYSQPTLTCDDSIWSETTAGHTPCLDSIRSRDIDITTYTTHSMVRDLIALRQALGHEQWNLYGSSFSTSLMLLLMEADPDGTRSAVLQSVKPPNETAFANEADVALRAIEHLLQSCHEDEKCSRSFPDLEEQLFTTVRRLNRTPVDVTYRPVGETETVQVEMDGALFLDWVVISQLYRPAFPPFGAAYLPLIISEVDGGDTRLLAGAAGVYWNQWLDASNWSWGLMLAVNCQQDYPAAGEVRTTSDQAASDRLDGFLRQSRQRELCDAWNLEAQPPAAETYLQNDVPALIMAGSFDPVTPPIWSRTTAENLPNATYVEFSGYGHDVVTDNPCVGALEAAFIDDPSAPLDIGCVAMARTAEFVTPEDVFVAPGLIQGRHEVNVGGPDGVPWLNTLAIAGMIGMLALTATLTVGGGLWLRRRRRTDVATIDRIATDHTLLIGYIMALAVAAATIVIPSLLTAIADAYPDTNRLDVIVGPSRDLLAARLVAWLIPLTALVVAALAALTTWAWSSQRWPRLFRAATTLVVLFALPMMYLSWRWDLFTMAW